MKLTDLFEQIAIINLPERKDRKRQIKSELKRLGLNFSSPGVVLYAANQPDTASGFPSRGAHGAYLSHLNVLRQARRDGVRSLLVMEDDLLIDSRLKAALPKLALETQTIEWSLIYLGHLGASRLGPVRLANTNEPQQCLHCYAVHQRAFDDLIAYLECCLQRPAGHPEGGAMHVDGAVSMFRQFHKQHSTYLVQPSMGAQRPSRSNIAQNQWYDRTPVIRECVGMARALKYQWREIFPRPAERTTART